jgi:alpha-mannosidase
MLNVPIESAEGAAELAPIASVGAPNVIVEAVKPAEDDSDAFVLRLYECEGTKAQTAVRFGAPVARAVLTNMLEDEKQPLALADDTVELSFRPFEIKTVKLYRKPEETE